MVNSDGMIRWLVDASCRVIRKSEHGIAAISSRLVGFSGNSTVAGFPRTWTAYQGNCPVVARYSQ